MRFKTFPLLLFFLLYFLKEGVSQQVTLRETSTGIEFLLEGRQVLRYQTSKEPVPKGIKEAYSKSGFIHPIQSPSGQILSRIQPVDHYHHYGIWGPWARATVGGREVDFWNLGDEKGRVDFSHIIAKKQAGGAAEVIVRQNHVDLKAPKEAQVALEEDLRIKVKPADKGRYLVDYTSTLRTPLKDGVLLDDYRYGGGIGFRATEAWGDSTSTILTSEGKNRASADGTSARWILVTGQSDHPTGKSGILFLSHSNNPSHPEPLRVWPLGQYNGKGNVFIEFCPIRYNSWEILPNQNYLLTYRMIVFDGELSREEAENYWKSYVK